MKHPDFLDNRDFTGEDKKRPSTLHMDTSYKALEGDVKNFRKPPLPGMTPAICRNISKRASTWRSRTLPTTISPS